MKTDYELERVGDLPRTNDDRLAEIDEMPPSKVAEVYAAASISKVVCDECEAETWLVAPAGHNSQSECHECGESYKTVG